MVFLHRPLNKTQYCYMFSQTSQQKNILLYVFTDLSTKHNIVVCLHRRVKKTQYVFLLSVFIVV